MKKILFGLLTLGSVSTFAQSTEQVSVSYDCDFKVSKKELRQKFSGKLELKENQFATRPVSRFEGAINTYAKEMRLYLIRSPENLNLVYVTLQSSDNYYNAMTLTPGGQHITKPLIYSADVSYIKEQSPVGTSHEINGRGKRKKFSGELTCTFL